MWTYNYNNELYHYGVIGMKWGVRRSAKRLALAAKNKRNTELDNTFDADKRKAIKETYKSEMKKIKLDKSTKLAEIEASKSTGQKFVGRLLKASAGVAVVGGAYTLGKKLGYKNGENHGWVTGYKRGKEVGVESMKFKKKLGRFLETVGGAYWGL